MTMMCVRCYLEGRRVPVGMQVTKNPPFSFMIYEGESRCVDHIPAPAAAEAPVPAGVPERFPPLEIVPEQVLTDNRFVVEEDTTPKKSPAKKTAAKKAAKRTPAKKVQQRKRTKS